MSNTFRDVSKVRGFSPKLDGGRPAPKGGGYKEKFDGTVRSTFKGRHDTFLNDSTNPKPDRSKSAVKYGK